MVVLKSITSSHNLGIFPAQTSLTAWPGLGTQPRPNEVPCDITQGLTLGERVRFLDNGPKLIAGQPNSRKNNIFILREEAS